MNYEAAIESMDLGNSLRRAIWASDMRISCDPNKEGSYLITYESDNIYKNWEASISGEGGATADIDATDWEVYSV